MDRVGTRVPTWPLRKGVTRVATMLWVPLVPLIVWLCVVVLAVQFAGLVCLIAAPIGWAVMFGITRYDPRAFRILGLWIQTRLRNWRALGHWRASAYAPVDYRERRARWAPRRR